MSKQLKQSWTLFIAGSVVAMGLMWWPSSAANALPVWVKVALSITTIGVLFIEAFAPRSAVSDREYWARRTGRW